MPQMKTNPIFKEIIFKCWENEGENPSSSYQDFIGEAIKELYPQAQPSKSVPTDLWKEMRANGLAKSERAGNKWKFTLCNPNDFDWDCSEKVQYKWLKPKPPKPAVPAVVEALSEIPIPKAPAEIIQQELEAARLRLEEFRKKIASLFLVQALEIGDLLQAWQMWEENLQKTIKPYEEIIDNLNARTKCLQEIQTLGSELRAVLLDQGGEENASEEE